MLPVEEVLSDMGTKVQLGKPPKIEGYTAVQKYSDCADRFRTDRRLVRAIIFVDETLVQVDGNDYWLWVAYE
jgi:hypothetical protein